MSMLPRSFAARTFAVLAVAAAVAVVASEPARSDSGGIVLTNGGRHDHGRRGHGGRDHWRGDRGHDGGHWRGQRRHGHGRHWRHRPPAWAFQYHAPAWRPYVRHCRVVWSDWHGGYVKVCG